MPAAAEPTGFPCPAPLQVDNAALLLLPALLGWGSRGGVLARVAASAAQVAPVVAHMAYRAMQ